MTAKKQKAGFWIGLLVSLGFVAAAFATYDFGAVWEALKSANYWWVIPAAVVELLVLYIRVIRWHYFLEPIKPVSHYNACMATFIGFSANMTLPARIGEFLRAWLLGKKEGMSKSAVMGTVVIERAIDGLTMVVIVVMVLTVVEVPEGQSAYWETLQMAGYLFSALFVGAFAALYMLYKRIGWVETLIDLCMKIVPEQFRDRVRELLESFRRGFDFLGHSHHLIAITFWSFLFWLVAGGLNLAFFHAFGLGDIPLIATYLILIAQVVGVMIPSPGFVGPYHAATIAALAFYGIDQEHALSMAIIMHATMFLTNTIPGLFYLAHERMSLTGLQESSEAEEGEE